MFFYLIRQSDFIVGDYLNGCRFFGLSESCLVTSKLSSRGRIGNIIIIIMAGKTQDTKDKTRVALWNAAAASPRWGTR